MPRFGAGDKKGRSREIGMGKKLEKMPHRKGKKSYQNASARNPFLSGKGSGKAQRGKTV